MTKTDRRDLYDNIRLAKGQVKVDAMMLEELKSSVPKDRRELKRRARSIILAAARLHEYLDQLEEMVTAEQAPTYGADNCTGSGLPVSTFEVQRDDEGNDWTVCPICHEPKEVNHNRDTARVVTH